MGSLGEAVLGPRAGGKKGDSGIFGETEFCVYCSLSQPTVGCPLDFVSETGFENLFEAWSNGFREFSGGPEGYNWRCLCNIRFFSAEPVVGPIPDVTLRLWTWEQLIIGDVTIKTELPPPAYIIRPPVVTVSTCNEDSPPPA